MLIRNLKVCSVKIPLIRPKGISKKQISHRDYVIITVETDDGITGWSYTWGFPGTHMVIETLREIVVGTSLYDITGCWQRMFSTIDDGGRGGVGMAASLLSTIPLGCLGKSSVKLFISFRCVSKRSTVYHSGGYYPSGCSSENEMLSFLEYEMGTAMTKAPQILDEIRCADGNDLKRMRSFEHHRPKSPNA